MKIKNCISLLLLIVLILHENALHACSDGPSPYFGSPTYIDPDYKVLGYDDAWYRRRRRFDFLLSQFATFRSNQNDSNDIAARQVSAQKEAKSYASYLQAAERFQSQDYNNALTMFTELKNTTGSQKKSSVNRYGADDYSWVKEASTYMIARCQLTIAQNDWDGYSSPATLVDQNTLKLSDSLYSQYLKEYPAGLYANSARNIRRKMYFLSGQQSLLDQELKQAMLEQFPVSAEFVPGRYIDREIIDEFETYFHGEIDFAHDSPILAAYVWLSSSQKANPQDVRAIEAREKDFSAYPGLFRYVRALGLYKIGQYQELIEKTPEEPKVKSTLWLSTQILRVRAFEGLGDNANALLALSRMHQVSPEDAVEAEIAFLKFNAGDGLQLFSDTSSIVSEDNLRAFALLGFTDKELEDGLKVQNIRNKKRQVLASELARRYILTGRFKELALLMDKEQIPDFTSVKTLITKLAANSHDIQALVDLGEFLYTNFITPSRIIAGADPIRGSIYPLADLMPRCERCKNYEQRFADYTPPMWFFQTAVDMAKKTKVKSESEAKALHYIVIGGRYGEWGERCTWRVSSWGNATTLSTSKEAFTRLHKLYNNSEWAAKTPYYYD